MTDHQEKADQVEAELDELERESQRLEAQIGGTRDEWEQRKADDNVPGADGKPEAADSGLPPEAEQQE